MLLCFNRVLDLAINCFGNKLFEKLIYGLFCVYCSSQNEIQNWILLHVQFSPLIKNRERERERESTTLFSMDDPERMYTVYYFRLSLCFDAVSFHSKDIHYGICWKHFLCKTSKKKAEGSKSLLATWGVYTVYLCVQYQYVR